MKGLISYRTERSEVYRNRVKRGYIAFAQRIYRLTKKREGILAIKPIVLSFYLYKAVGLARNTFDWSNAMLALSGNFIILR